MPKYYSLKIMKNCLASYSLLYANQSMMMGNLMGFIHATDFAWFNFPPKLCKILLHLFSIVVLPLPIPEISRSCGDVSPQCNFFGPKSNEINYASFLSNYADITSIFNCTGSRLEVQAETEDIQSPTPSLVDSTLKQSQNFWKHGSKYHFTQKLFYCMPTFRRSRN